MRIIPDSASFRERNTCHLPPGRPDGGQFCGDEDYPRTGPPHQLFATPYQAEEAHRDLQRYKDRVSAAKRKAARKRADREHAF